MDGSHKRLRVAYADEEEEWPISEAGVSSALSRACRRVPRQTSSFVFRRLRARPFWLPSDAGSAIASLCASLEAQYEPICSEVKRLLRPLLGDDGSSSSDEGGGAEWAAQGEGLHAGCWSRLVLWARGQRHAANLARLPSLAALLDASSALMRDAPGRAYLSVMTDGTKVRPHSGPTNHRLRIHFPLLLPAGLPAAARARLGIRVGGELRLWQAGRCLLLDDSFEHEVDLPARSAEDGGEPWVRVILVLDVWHPDAEWLVPPAARAKVG
jgi:aspartate beta-hydroxylase